MDQSRFFCGCSLVRVVNDHGQEVHITDRQLLLDYGWSFSIRKI